MIALVSVTQIILPASQLAVAGGITEPSKSDYSATMTSLL